MNSNEEMNFRVNKGMDLYFEMKENEHLLNENNKMLIGQIENAMASLPSDSYIKRVIDERLVSYDKVKHTNINNTQDLKNPLMIANQERELVPTRTLQKINKTGFINNAILLYGLINIGIILALALLK